MRFQIDLSSLFGGKTIDQSHEEKLNQLLDFPEPASFPRLIQNTAAYFYARLGEKTRWHISSAIKSRNPKSSRSLPSIPPSQQLIDIARVIGSTEYLKGQPAVLLMTHDVDYATCYRNISWIAEFEVTKKIKSSYNFLVHSGYSIDSHLLRDLKSMGHEIGLHGYLYDLRLAYRKKAVILSALKKAKEKLENILGEKIHGFRNHSLLLSHDLLSVIADLGFLYDTGIYPKFNNDGFYGFFCFPFKYRNTDLYEIPVLYPQDTEMFRSAGLDDKGALECVMKKIKLVRDLNGVACINHHPTIIEAHRQYYGELLGYIASETIANVTPATLIRKYFL
jgi:hypothetical protein